MALAELGARGGLMRKRVIVYRPWGRFERFTLNERSTVKLLYINRGMRLSYQYHRKRSELWIVVSGKVRIYLDGARRVLGTGMRLEVPRGARHRIEALSSAVVLELAFGKFDEQDIVRLYDDFGRAK